MFLLRIHIIFVCLLAIYSSAYAQTSCTGPDGIQGSCTSILQCEKIFKVLSDAPRPLPISVVNFLNKYHCGFSGDMPKVCCELDIKSNSTSISEHKNMKLLPINNCGPIWTNKISGGNKTDLFEYPWMVLLQYQTSDGLKFLCGGSLINERYVLTAAHCVEKLLSTNKLVSVRLGEYDTSKDVDCQTIDDEEICADPVQDIPVEEVRSHPLYDKPKWSNDIAVIRLSRSANLEFESVTPICLPITDHLVDITPKRVLISGWGTTEKQTTSDQLLDATLPVVSNDKCQEQFRRSIRIMASQMCAGGETGIDSCKGDSGGPLMYPETLKGTKMIQFGIISVGIESCLSTSNYPGVYTRVSYFIPWILDQLRL